MSEILTIGTGSATIYGSFAGGTGTTGAKAYFDVSGSDAAAAWQALADDNARKKKLLDASRFLNRLGYVTAYVSFAARDALDLGTGDGDAAFPFRAAMYELAAAATVDPDVLNVDDQGSNISRIYGDGAGIDYFNPTSSETGTASPLPKTVMDLIGAYLAIGALDTSGAGTGDSAGCVNPFGPCRDYDKRGPW